MDSEEDELLAGISYGDSPSFDDLWEQFAWIFKGLALADPRFLCLPKIFEGGFEQYGDGTYGAFGLLTPEQVLEVNEALSSVTSVHWDALKKFALVDSGCCVRKVDQLPDSFPGFENFAHGWKQLAENGDGVWTSWM